MLSLALGALALPASTAVENADHWAVLVAGSNGYGNYRHQADVCHAYHVVVNQGIPKSNIIVMAADDIANNRENPFPGKMFNKPTPAGTPGVDVYEGCKIDWSGRTVTPANFAKVLTGGDSVEANSTAKAKVLGSTSKSKVFVNFVDHGGVGLIGFGNSIMHVKELAAALKTMHDNNMYKELVFYLEACESGSMFPAGTLQPGMYATTASNAKESSWGTYCMPDDKVNGKSIGSCLGDLYSVNWMEDSDKATSGETLEDQFVKVKAVTSKSHVTEFGDKDVAAEPLVNFQGDSNAARAVAPSVVADAAGTAAGGDAAEGASNAT
jgi:legumain